MSKFIKLCPWCAIAILAAAVVGCGSKPAAKQQAAPGNTQAAADNEEATIAANLASLSPEDRALAEKQKVCPVSDARLGGSMGAPVKLDVKGRAVFICCDNCKQEVLDNPDKYLAKLGLATDAPPAMK